MIFKNNGSNVSNTEPPLRLLVDIQTSLLFKRKQCILFEFIGKQTTRDLIPDPSHWTWLLEYHLTLFIRVEWFPMLHTTIVYKEYSHAPLLFISVFLHDRCERSPHFQLSDCSGGLLPLYWIRAPLIIFQLEAWI